MRSQVQCSTFKVAFLLSSQNQTIEMLKDRLLSHEAVRTEPTQDVASPKL